MADGGSGAYSDDQVEQSVPDLGLGHQRRGEGVGVATVGPPEVDVAWCTFFQKFWASAGEPFGIEVPAMFDTQATVATYIELGGAPLDELAWYEALAGLRFGIILARMSLRSVAHGMQEIPADPDDMIMFAPLLDRLLGDL